MTTMITQESKTRVPHHPARIVESEEAAWRARRRSDRILRVLLILSWISVVALLVTAYVLEAST